MSKQLHNKVNKELLREQLKTENKKRKTLSFYRYANILNPKLFRDHLYLKLDEIEVFGRVYIAREGVNGQISVPEEHIEELKTVFNSISFFDDLRLNFAIEEGDSFIKLAIKVRDKIVADGLNDELFDVTKKGKHLKAKEFNEMVERDDVLIVDMRNHYECEVGHFQDAILPDAETFREALPMVEDILKPEKDKHIIMYCTGGIRCEKASAYYKHKGFENVYQLEGGIIEYARQVENEGLENKFIGKNFVFDDRLGERISESIIAKCHQCGVPCDIHTNCANDACHILFIQCESCKSKYENTCSAKCKDFNMLTEEERAKLKPTMEFNGTKFGKGRYKANRKNQELD